MASFTDVQCGSAPPSLAAGSRGLARWVCTQNPFYVLSALLVCLGLWDSFGSHADAAQTWAMLSGMAGYTLLLATTACLLVRFVGVWDDVRTLLLLVVLMFLATSVTFDEVLARSPTRGVACYLAGLLIAVAISEAMLRVMRLALPPLFRAPYYLILALFFVYPVAITPLLDRPASEALSWALFGFSPVAGLTLLTLLPAVRRGRDYVRDNGSPWRWAWYPWTLFGVLAFGAGARSALLCWSMHHVPLGVAEPYIFGGYFLVPLGLAIGVVLLEIGLVERLRAAVATAMFVPFVLLALAMVGHRPETFYQGFLTQFSTRLGGTPLYLTLLASAAFYAYAALRRVPLATDAFSGLMVALAFVSPTTLDLDSLVAPRPVPLLVAGILQLGLGLRRREAWRCLAGACCLVVPASIAWPGTIANAHRGAIVFHLILAAVLVIGTVCDDRLGRLLRSSGAAMALLGSLVVTMGGLDRDGRVPTWVVEVYPLVMSALLAGYGFLFAHRISVASAGIILSFWLVATGWRGYSALRQVIVGIDYITVGMALFSLAVLTSLAKGGVLPWKLAGHTGKVPYPHDQ